MGKQMRRKDKRATHLARENQREKDSQTLILPSFKAAPPRPAWDLTTEEQVLVKNTICPGASDLEFQLCITEARHRRLDPIKKQIWFVPRWNSQAENADGTKGRKVWVPQVSIDGLRHIAARDHRDYGNEDEVEYGPMHTVTWNYTYQGKLKEKSIQAPEWARVSIWKKGATRPTVATVWWDEVYPDISTSPLVQRMPRLMLGKCASAQANRRAYPETGGLYIPEEFYGNKPDFSPDGRHLVYPDTGTPVSKAIEAEIDSQKAGNTPAAPAQAKIKPDGGKEAPPTASAQPGQPEPPKTPPVGDIIVDWSENEANPIVRGDLANVLPVLEKHCTMKWIDDWWHCLPKDVETIRQMCDAYNYRLTEMLPKSSAATPAGRPCPPADAPTAKGKGERTSAGAPPTVALPPVGEPGWVTGIIEQANPESGKAPRVKVLFKIGKAASFWMSCFDKAIFGPLMAGKGKEATLIIQRRTKENKTFTNIIGLKKVGETEYDDDGKTPVIQQSTREAGRLFTP